MTLLRVVGARWYVSLPTVLFSTFLAVLLVGPSHFGSAYATQGTILLSPTQYDAQAHEPAAVTLRTAVRRFEAATKAEIESLFGAEIVARPLPGLELDIAAFGPEGSSPEPALRAAASAVGKSLEARDLRYNVQTVAPVARRLPNGSVWAGQRLVVSQSHSARGSQAYAATTGTAQLLAIAVMRESSSDRLESRTPTFVDLDIVVRSQDVAPVLQIAVQATTAGGATDGFWLVHDALEEELEQQQERYSVPDYHRARLEVLDGPTTAGRVSTSLGLPYVGLLAFSIVMAILAAFAVDRASAKRAGRPWQLAPLADRGPTVSLSTARNPADTLLAVDTDSGRKRLDVVAYLSVWLVLLYGINANQVVGPLGAIGTPAMLVAGLAAAAWYAGRILPDSQLATDPQPLRPLLLVLTWLALASLAVAFARPLTGIEQFGALRAAAQTIALAGLALLVSDGVDSVGRLQKLLRRLAIAATALAALGLVQSVTGLPLQIDIPGLRWNYMPIGVGTRSLFNRPAATALHPIEFSVVTGALFPLALHFLLYLPPGRSRKFAVASTIIIGLAIPLSISRSGLVSVAIGLLVLCSGWTWQWRFRALVAGGMILPMLWLSIPGLVGTLRYMFAGHETDDSIQGRLERIPRIMELIRERPWLGRGEGTFNVEQYFVADNGAYVKVIESGAIGTLAFLAVLCVGIYLGLGIAHRPRANGELAHLGRAVAAGIAALAISFLTFDAGVYRILMGTLFMLLGSAGALWRLTGDVHSAASGDDQWRSGEASNRPIAASDERTAAERWDS